MMYSTSINLHLFVRRKPVLFICIVLILVFLSSYFVINLFLERELKILQRQITTSSAELTSNQQLIDLPVSTDLREEFYDELGYLSHVDEPLTLLFALAKETGISIGQSQFRYRPMLSTKMAAYEITIPAKGSYPAIRDFCERFLLAVPFASLTELNLKRDSSQQTQIDGKLRLTLYLKTQAIKPLKQLD